MTGPVPGTDGPLSPPRYIELDGDQVYRHPYFVRDAQYYYFAVEADRDAMQATVDRSLNAVMGDAPGYEVVSSLALVHFGIAQETGSLDEVDTAKGTYVERSAGAWMLIRPRGARRLVLYPYYYFVDMGPAMASGREVYGIRKGMGTIRLPAAPPQRLGDPTGPFCVDTLVLPEYAETTQGRTECLLYLDCVTPRRATAGRSWWGTLWDIQWDFLLRFARQLDEVWDGLTGPDMPAHHVLLALFGKLRYPVVFLKQIRDACDPNLAAYQAIIEAPATIEGWRDGDVLFGDYALAVHSSASHPLRRDFGFGPNPVPVKGGFYADYAFSLGMGREVWRAPMPATPPDPPATAEDDWRFGDMIERGRQRT